MAKKVVTIDIDDTGIRLLEVDGNRVTKWGYQSLGPGTVEAGTVAVPQALAAALKDLSATSGIKTSVKNIVASISGLYAMTRILTLEGSAPPTRQAVLQHAHDSMSMPLDRLYVSWATVAAEEHVYRVLVIGIQRDLMDSQMQALKAARIRPRSLVLKAAALGRTVQSQQALIINIAPSGFDVVLVLDGITEIMRTIAWRPDSLTTEETVSELTAALETAVRFYDSQHPLSHVDRATPLFVTGEMSQDTSLIEQLEAASGYPVQSLVPPLEVPAGMPSSQYAASMGLALTDTAMPADIRRGKHAPPVINLLPDIYRGRKLSAMQFLSLWLIVAGIGLLVPFYQSTTDMMSVTARLDARFNAVTLEARRRQVEIKNRTPMEQTVKQYAAIVGMSGDFAGDLRLIHEEAAKLGVLVTAVVHDGKTISVDCEAATDVAFNKFVSALQSSPRFSSVTPPSPGYPHPLRGTIKLTPRKVAAK